MSSYYFPSRSRNILVAWNSKFYYCFPNVVIGS